MTGPVDGWGVVASLALVALAVGISLWLRLGLVGSIAWAGLRAAVQLFAVGAVFRLIFESARARPFAWLWVVGMVVVAAEVVQRRRPQIPGLRGWALGALILSTGVALGILFGLGVFEDDPVAVVVIAGITIGNVLPATVLAIDRVAAQLRDAPERVEGLLALGFDVRQVMRFVAPEAAGTALTAQIERTKVVGLIALPGAMTGLLLAGIDPVDAVMVQLVVMYLILGAVTLSVSVVTAAALAASFADGLRLPAWVRIPQDGGVTDRRRRRPWG